jgi:hypothetical protein
MRSHDTSGELSPSRSGILFITGHASSLRIDKGCLVARSGTGRDIREGRFSKVGRPKLRRVVVHAPGGGLASWSAFRWLEALDVSFLLLGRDAEPILASASLGADLPKLRRQQALACENGAAVRISKGLLQAKLDNQLANLERFFPDARHQRDGVIRSKLAMSGAPDIESLRLLESQAATAYWSAWRGLELHFGSKARGRTPSHWLTFQARQSPIARGPRIAADPLNATLNLLFALGEFEATVGFRRLGCDPGLAFAHADQAARNSASLDALEAIRGQIEAWALEMFATRTLDRRWFIERPNGNCRLAPEFVHVLAETLPMWERSIAPVVESIAKTLGKGSTDAGRRDRMPTPLTQANRSEGRSATRRGSRRDVTQTMDPVPRTCADCGASLPTGKVRYCEGCRAKRKAEILETLTPAGPAAVARLRAEGRDPMDRPEVRAKIAQKNDMHRREAAAWDAANPGIWDKETFRVEILPGLAHMTLNTIMRECGVSKIYASRIRRGLVVPHPRLWEALRQLAAHATEREAWSIRPGTSLGL